MICEHSELMNIPFIYYSSRKGKNKIVKKVSSFKPYFYVLAEEENVAMTQTCVKKVEKGFKSIFSEDVIKVFVDVPSSVTKIRQLFKKTYEADILFNLRYLIDEEPDFGDVPKFCFLDIEVDCPDGIFPEKKVARYPISCISLINSFDDKNYVTLYYKSGKLKEKKKEVWKNRITQEEKVWHKICCENEVDMIERFIDIVCKSDFDFFSGWNTDFFDLPYIISRCEKLKININKISPFGKCFVPPPSRSLRTKEFEEKIPVIKGRGIFDLLIPYKKMNVGELESYALNRVGEKELKVKKLEYKGSLHNLYISDFETYLKYNIADVELCSELNKKVGIVEYFWLLSKFIGCPLGDTMSNSRMGDIFALRFNKHNMKKALPTKTPTPPTTFRGAIVFEPKKGLHKNVIGLDLSKIYPSCIIYCNMSPETAVKEENKKDFNEKELICIGNGMYFRKDIQGFTPLMLQELFKLENDRKVILKDTALKYGYESDEYKRASRNRQFVKDLRNSIYGLLSYAGFRLYVPDVGACVTYMGRQILTFCKEILEKENYEVIYGDTDSLYVLSREKDSEKIDEISKEGKYLMKKVNESFDNYVKIYNIDKHNFKIEFEKVYKTLIILKKKHYDGFVSWYDGKPTIFRDTKGIEAKRTDNSKLTRKFMSDVLDLIHKTGNKEKVDNFTKDIIKEIVKADLEDIGIPKALHKNIDEYKMKTSAVKACLYSNNYLKTNMNKGAKPYFVYIKNVPRGYAKTDALCFEEKAQVPSGFEIDYVRMISLLIMSKIEKIYEAMQWNVENTDITIKDGNVKIMKQTTLR